MAAEEMPSDSAVATDEEDGFDNADEPSGDDSEPMSESTESAAESGSREGLVLNMTAGLHSTSQAVGSSATKTDESLAIEIHPAWRYSETQSIGLSYFLNTYSLPASASMKFHGVMTNWRYYLSFGPIEPFAELGLGWVWLSTSADAGAVSVSSTAKGINLAAGLGAVYHLLDYLGIGAHARINLPAFTSLCIDSGSGETCGTPSSNMKDISYGLTVVFNPFAL